MELRPLLAEEAAVRRYVEELRLPYNRDLEMVVDNYTLADGIEDVLDAEVEFRMDKLESERYRAWAALDPVSDGGTDDDLAVVDGDLVGFITTDIDEAPVVFDRPDRLLVGDIYVREEHRGEGLADELMEHAAERAQEEGCAELTLNVDVDNRCAIRFYEKLGFETIRNQMTVATEDCSRQIQQT